MDEAIRGNLARLEKALIQSAPPELLARGVVFRCRRRAATSRRPARYRVAATWKWNRPPRDHDRRGGIRPVTASTSTSCEHPDIESLFRSLPEFLADLVLMTRET